MLLLVESILLSYLLLSAPLPGVSSSKIITLESIKLLTNHNFMPFKITIYFRCQGEKITILPDVKEINLEYTFKGEESWQPLTALPENKCKRCGLYEKAFFKSDDVFDEWELCLDDFANGTYTHLKENEFTATFRCPETSEPSSNMDSHNRKRTGVALVATISMVVCAVVLVILEAGIKYWQKKREQEQARFLKMFEEVDDFEDELGIGPL